MRKLTLAATRFAGTWDLPAIADQTGAFVGKAGREAEAVITATFDMDATGDLRASWGGFRDRRPETYGALAGLDGRG